MNMFQADPQYGQALALLQSGQFKQSAEVFHRLNAVRANNADCLAGEAMAISRAGGRQNKRFQAEAVRLMKLAVSHAPGRSELHQNLGVCLEMYGDYTGAMEQYSEAVGLQPNNIAALVMLAVVSELVHDLDRAKDAVERVLAIDPKIPDARILRVQFEDREGSGDHAAHRAELEDVLSGSIDVRSRVSAEFMLGVVLGKLGEHESGFDAYARSNKAMGEVEPVPQKQRDEYIRKVNAIRDDLTPERLARWGEETYDDGLPAPALLVGFPRSGTTMTERILDAHDGVFTTEERPYFDVCTREMAQMMGDGANSEAVVLDKLTREQVLHLRQVYWKAVTTENGEVWKEKLLLDKLPLRIVRLGMVNRLFPEARVLVALRDPRDVCLSAFVQRFAINTAMSFFQDLHETARMYNAVMGLWLAVREHVTVACKEIRYEDTVEDFEGAARGMLDFLGLDWTDEVLRFHEKQRSSGVVTPSYLAVTKPVNRGAMGRWKRVENRLAPIFPVLQPYIDAFGYGED